jgi:hypothetical protein
MNWLDFMCRVGTTVAAVGGTAATGAAAGAVSGWLGGPIGSSAGAVAGAGAGLAGGIFKSGDLCDQAAHDMYMRQKCEALENGEMYVKVNGRQLATVKELANKNLMPPTYYKDIGACEEAGYLPKDSKGMTLP